MSGARRKEERWEPSATETVELTGTVDFRHLLLFLSQEEQKRSYNKNSCKYLIIHSPQGFSGIIYNTCWGTLPDMLKVQFTSTEGMSDDAPIHECESEIDHYTGHYVPYSLRRVCGFFNVPQIYYMCKGL